MSAKTFVSVCERCGTNLATAQEKGVFSGLLCSQEAGSPRTLPLCGLVSCTKGGNAGPASLVLWHRKLNRRTSNTACRAVILALPAAISRAGFTSALSLKLYAAVPRDQFPVLSLHPFA